MTDFKAYPNNTPLDLLRKQGASTLCLWQQRGPQNTNIAWTECWSVAFPEESGGGVIIVQTFDGGGWEIYTTCKSNSVADTIDDTMARLKPETTDPRGPITYDDIEPVWDALHSYRETQIPEGHAPYDRTWDEITLAMARLQEAAGIPFLTDEDESESDEG